MCTATSCAGSGGRIRSISCPSPPCSRVSSIGPTGTSPSIATDSRGRAGCRARREPLAHDSRSRHPQRAARTCRRVRAGLSAGAADHLVDARLRLARASALPRGREQVRPARPLAAARRPHRRVSQVSGISGMAAPAPQLLRPVPDGRALRIPFSWPGESQPPQSVKGLHRAAGRIRAGSSKEDSMHRIKLSVALLSLLVTATAVAQANTPAPRRFTLPEHGQFVIPVPTDWKGRGGQPATRERQPQSRDELRAAVQRGVDGAKTQALEKELRVVEFQGRTGPGFYFSATDRAPKPDEYKFLTQGAGRVGELSVTFTILTNDGQEAIVKQALDALKGATQEPTA